MDLSLSVIDDEDNPAYRQSTNMVKLDAALKKLLAFLSRMSQTTLIDDQTKKCLDYLSQETPIRLARDLVDEQQINNLNFKI